MRAVAAGISDLESAMGDIESARQYASRLRDFLVWAVLQGHRLESLGKEDVELYGLALLENGASVGSFSSTHNTLLSALKRAQRNRPDIFGGDSA